MKSKLHIIIAAILASCVSSFAQPNWVVNESADSMQLILHENAFKEAFPLDSGDIIGAFTDTSTCIGLTTWSGDSTVLNVYSNFSVYLKEIHFKVWDSQRECVYGNVEYTSDAWTGSFDTSEAYFEINSLNAVADSLFYSNDEYSSTVSEVTIGGVRAETDYTFTASDALDINFVTGSISPNNSVPGTYTIIPSTSEYCLKNIEFSITISSNAAKNNYVISPSSKKPENRKIYFNKEGTIKILDFNGRLVKEITGPGEWDGTNQNGNFVTNSEYYILFEDGTMKTVTFLR